MKLNFKYTLATLALAALFASCDRTAEFKSEKFISVDNNSYSVTEVAGEVTIPVHVYNADNNEVNVSVTVLPGTAEEGADFEVVTPASGVLTFAAGETTKEVKIAIKSHEGVYTGNKNFAIQVASATEGVLVGKFDTSLITINDLDHPLSKFIGDWSGDFNTGRGLYAGHTIHRVCIYVASTFKTAIGMNYTVNGVTRCSYRRVTSAFCAFFTRRRA